MENQRSDKKILERQDRIDKRSVAAHVDKHIYSDFKLFSSEQVKTTDAMLHEAIAALYKKYQRPMPRALYEKLKRLGIS